MRHLKKDFSTGHLMHSLEHLAFCRECEGGTFYLNSSGDVRIYHLDNCADSLSQNGYYLSRTIENDIEIAIFFKVLSGTLTLYLDSVEVASFDSATYEDTKVRGIFAEAGQVLTAVTTASVNALFGEVSCGLETWFCTFNADTGAWNTPYYSTASGAKWCTDIEDTFSPIGEWFDIDEGSGVIYHYGWADSIDPPTTIPTYGWVWNASYDAYSSAWVIDSEGELTYGTEPYSWTNDGSGSSVCLTATNTQPSAPSWTPTIYYTWEASYDCYSLEWYVYLSYTDTSGTESSWSCTDYGDYMYCYCVTTSSTQPSNPTELPTC